mgnify:FL=1
MKSLLRTLLDFVMDYQWTLLISNIFIKDNDKED